MLRFFQSLTAMLIAAGSLSAQDARTLRYGFRLGEVYHYDIEMRFRFSAGNHGTIHALETLVVAGVDGDRMTILPLASGLRIGDLSIQGQDLNALAEHPGRDDPFLGGAWRFEGSPKMPPNLPLGKVIVRLRNTGAAPPEEMVPRFWSLLFAIGEWIQTYHTAGAYPWVALPVEQVAVGDSWDLTVPGDPDTFHYTYVGPDPESELPCDLVHGSLNISPEISAVWGAWEGVAIRTRLCLAREGGFPVYEEFQASQTLGDGKNEQQIRAVLVARDRLDDDGLRIVREAADSMFPAIQPAGSEALQALMGNPVPELELEDAGGASSLLSDYRGRVVVAHFWPPWSRTGSQALSEILAGTSNLDPGRVVVLPIVVESESSRLLGISSAVLKGMDRSPTGFKPVTDDLAAFRANEIVPMTVIVDTDGFVQKTFLGYVRKGELTASIEALLPDRD